MENVDFSERFERIGKLYNEAEELDTQLGEDVLTIIQPLVDEGKYNEAINKVLEIYGENIEITHSGRVLITTLRLKIAQGETF